MPDFGEETSDPLPLADRRDDVDDAARDVLLGLDVAFQDQCFVREERRQVLEQDLALAFSGGSLLTLSTLTSAVALAVLRRADLASIVSPVCRLKRRICEGEM